MNITLKALISYFKNSTNYETVEEYNEQIDADGIKKSFPLPALMPHFREMRIINNQRWMNFQLLSVTRSKSFDREKNKKTNLDLVTEVIDQIIEQPGFIFQLDNNNYSFEISIDTLRVTTLLISNAMVMHGITIDIRYL